MSEKSHAERSGRSGRSGGGSPKETPRMGPQTLYPRMGPQTLEGTRNTPLVPKGTVADIYIYIYISMYIPIGASGLSFDSMYGILKSGFSSFSVI